MMNAQQLGEKIKGMFNFIYEVSGKYYILGRDYFEPCSDLQYEVYKGFCEAVTDGNKENIIAQYQRVRRYTSDCQSNSRERDEKIIDFVNSLDMVELQSLNEQVNKAEEYARIAYAKK